MARHIINVVFVSMLLFCMGPLTAACATEPAQCLLNIGRAVQEADWEALTEQADIDALLNSALDSYLQEIGKPGNKGQLPPLMALMFSQLGDANDSRLRTLLLSEARAFLQNAVTSGAFAGKKLNNAQTRGVLAPLFADASLGKKEIRGIGEPIRNGADWIVPFSVHDYGNGNDYEVKGRFVKENGRCRLKRIENMADIIDQIKEEAAENY